MRLFLILITFFYSLSMTGAQADCDKCDMEIIKQTQENISQLTFEMMEQFLCTFDESCNGDVDFYRWSNETLFDAVHNAPELFLKVLQYGDMKNQKLIMKQLASPVHEGINVELVRIKIEKTEDKYMFKEEVLSALD